MGKIKKAVRRAAEKVKQFTAWSYSRYKDHRTCPRFAHWKHILKKPEGPKSPAMQRGGDIHKEGELYLLGKKRIVPASFKAFAAEVAVLRKSKAIAEGKWAMTAAWKAIDFFDWTHAWCRVVLDAHFMPTKTRFRVIDFKTGKVYLDDNLEQMELYAISGFEHYPTAEEGDTELWYLDQPRGRGNPLVKSWKRSQMPALQAKWRKKVIPILMDKRFVPNPNFTCGRCPYSKRKGGECKF